MKVDSSEAQYQNQESLGLAEPSYQNTADVICNNNNHETGDGGNGTTVTSSSATNLNNVNNNTINEEPVKKNGMAAADTTTSDASAHLDNNSQNNISKANINENNQISNNQNLPKSNLINNNTDELYDIPVGEYRIKPCSLLTLPLLNFSIESVKLFFFIIIAAPYSLLLTSLG